MALEARKVNTKMGVFFLMLVLAVGAGCDNDTPPATAKAIVHGRVTAASGEPVNEAGVLLLAHFISCDSTGVSQGVTYTHGSGNYLGRIKDVSASEIACLTLKVDAPPISNDHNDADSTFTTDFRLKSESPYDSIRVDITIPSDNSR